MYSSFSDVIRSSTNAELLALFKEGKGDRTDKRGSAVLDLLTEDEHTDLMTLLVQRLSSKVSNPVAQAHMLTRVMSVMAESLRKRLPTFLSTHKCITAIMYMYTISVSCYGICM